MEDVRKQRGSSGFFSPRRLMWTCAGFQNLSAAFPRQRMRGPTFYPVACNPQAWAAATPLYLLQSCLGLSFQADVNRVISRRPVLPAFLDEIMLTGLSLPAGRVNAQVRRAHQEFVVEVLGPFGGDRSADDKLSIIPSASPAVAPSCSLVPEMEMALARAAR